MAARSFIPREVRPFVLSILLVATLIHFAYGWTWALPFWLLVGLLVYLFRDPNRVIPAIPLAVVSPVDGRVVAIDTVRDPYIDREAIRITLAMTPFDVYFIRSPIEGRVARSWYVSAQSASSAQEEPVNDSRGIGVWLRSDEGDEGDDVVVVLSAGHLMRARCYAQMGRRIGQGQRCGYVPFGSRMEVLLPKNSRIRVAVGDTVRAGSDVIATLIHR
jgi:phosphatidylserine decarboxylase